MVATRSLEGDLGPRDRYEALSEAGIRRSELPWTLRGDRYGSTWVVDPCDAASFNDQFSDVVRAVLFDTGMPFSWGGGMSTRCFVPRRLVPKAVAILRERLGESFFHYSDYVIEPALSVVSGEHHQAIVVRPLARGSHRAEVEAFERADEDAPWRSVQSPVPAVIGRAGAIGPDRKREGDGATPGGMHVVGPAFGYAPSIATRLRYRQATAGDWWVDDPASPDYNTWVTVKPACSAEAMRRDDGQYELGAVLGWNTDPVEPGRGSAIFLHVWKGPDEPTSGCVALAREDTAALLRWLDADHAPVLVEAWPPGGW